MQQTEMDALQKTSKSGAEAHSCVAFSAAWPRFIPDLCAKNSFCFSPTHEILIHRFTPASTSPPRQELRLRPRFTVLI